MLFWQIVASLFKKTGLLELQNTALNEARERLLPKLMSGEIEVKYMTESENNSALNPRIDLLDRQEFVDRMLMFAGVLSDNKKNACYAVNGDWGIGKSFVLDMFEEQAQEIQHETTAQPRYIIFRYDCWEYDYYEEPLVGIIASMVNQIDEKVKLISEDTRIKVSTGLNEARKILSKIATQFLNAKTGMDFTGFSEAVSEGIDNLEEADQQLDL